jgi:hypothetical protein
VAPRAKNDRVNPLGLFDRNRRIRPLGEAYRDLIARWRDTSLLPNGPLTLVGTDGGAAGGAVRGG